MSVLVGSGAEQVPVNGSLGKLAFKDTALPFVELKSSAYQVTVNDVNKVLVVSGTTTITLPLASEVWGKKEPFIIAIKALTGATVTVARSGSDTIETVAGNKTMTANTGLWFFPVSASAWESL
jgi:hypothetical protein